MKASLERCTLIVNLNNYSNKVPIPHLVYFSTFMFIKKNFQSFENHSVPYRKVLSQSNDRKCFLTANLDNYSNKVSNWVIFSIFYSLAFIMFIKNHFQTLKKITVCPTVRSFHNPMTENVFSRQIQTIVATKLCTSLVIFFLNFNLYVYQE